MMFRNVTSRRVLFAALALCLAVGAAAGLVTPQADAAGQEIEHLYYSDASHSQIVGLWLRTCWGGVYSYGTRTPYKVTTYSSCS